MKVMALALALCLCLFGMVIVGFLSPDVAQDWHLLLLMALAQALLGVMALRVAIGVGK